MNDNFTFIGTRAPYNDAKMSPPKKAYDLEYSTQTKREFEFLKEHSIDPTYIKISEYGIRTYKYTKTPALFKLLTIYYSEVKAEKEYSKLNKDLKQNAVEADTETLDTLIEHGAPLKKVQIYA